MASALRLRPPAPLVDRELLAKASMLHFRPCVASRAELPELGNFMDAAGNDVHLVLAHMALSGCAFALAYGPPGLVPFLFTRGTYLVLHEGTGGGGIATSDIQWEGRSWIVFAGWDGFRPVATAVSC